VNVGFYYHVEAVFEREGVARVPALFGRFVEQLAKQVGRVTLYVHGESPAGIEDYTLTEPLVRCIDLGPRRRFPERMFMPSRSLRAFRPDAAGIDVMLIRGPTPLLPHLVKASGEIPVALHIVGEYAVRHRDRKARSMPWWRDEMIKALFRAYTRRERRASNDALVLVNAPHLEALFKGHDNVDVVFESTLMQDTLVDEPRRAEPGIGLDRPARLLFAGRLIPEKGLWEAVEAVRILTDRGLDATLDIAGWEAPSDPITGALREHIERRDVSDRVRFLGYVPAGPRLADVYKHADVFVLPSHGDGEGFPRTIFEAMGAGVPVVTTAVGGIPDWIQDGRQVVVVERHSAESLANGIQTLLTDEDLRSRVTRCGLYFAREHTLEKGCELLAGRLAQWLQDRRVASSN
jgi:glycosyltransferase involved in cell wall biosynthesis